MSGTGQESEEAMRGWHARQAWKFIGIAARQLDELRAELERLEAVEPVAWAISYDGKTPYMLWESGDGPLLALEVKRHGGTACKLPLYTAPIAPSIPALTDADVRAELASQHDDEGHVHFLKLAGWAYALAAERAGVQIKEGK